MSCGIGCRRGWDLLLLWLWRGQAAVAPIRPLAQARPYAAGSYPPTPRKKEKRISSPPLTVLLPPFRSVWLFHIQRRMTRQAPYYRQAVGIVGGLASSLQTNLRRHERWGPEARISASLGLKFFSIKFYNSPHKRRECWVIFILRDCVSLLLS